MNALESRQLAGQGSHRVFYRLLLLAAIVATAHASDIQPRTRSFHFTYTATVKDVPEGAKRLNVWLPVPHDDTFQHITNLKVVSPYPYEPNLSADGNTILHIGVESPAQSTFFVTMSFDAVRQEHIQPLAPQKISSIRDEEPAQLAQYLKADRLVPIDGQIRAWANDVVSKANAHTDLERARAIYKHVVATVKYDKSGKGWGRGDRCGGPRRRR